MSKIYKKQYTPKKDTSFYGSYVSPFIETIQDQFKTRQRVLSGKKPYNNSQTGKYSSD